MSSIIELYACKMRSPDQWTIPLLDKLLKSKTILVQLERGFLIRLNCEVWLQNIVKCCKYVPVKCADFVYFYNMVVRLFCVLYKSIYKICQILLTGLHFPHFMIFRNQTSLNLMKFWMLFPAVLTKFSQIKNLFNRGLLNSTGYYSI